MPTKPLAQPQRTQSAEEFYKVWIAQHPKLLGKSVTWPIAACLFEFAEAYAQSLKQAAAPQPRTDIFEMHQMITAGLFPAYSNQDERFLSLALAGEVGELCNMVKKRWRDGADFTEEIRDELADIRVYLELAAKCFGIEGAKLDAQVESKLRRVAKRFNIKLEPAPTEPFADPSKEELVIEK